MPVSVAQGDGSLFVLTSAGGHYDQAAPLGDGTLLRFFPGGSYAELYEFGANSTDGQIPLSVMLGTDGSLYGVTNQGGTHGPSGEFQNGDGTAFRVTQSGKETVLYSFGASSADGTLPVSLIQGTDGNLYGITSTGGTNNSGTLFKLTISPGG